eukprot:gene19396-37849_t
MPDHPLSLLLGVTWDKEASSAEFTITDPCGDPWTDPPSVPARPPPLLPQHGGRWGGACKRGRRGAVGSIAVFHHGWITAWVTRIAFLRKKGLSTEDAAAAFAQAGNAPTPEELRAAWQGARS